MANTRTVFACAGPTASRSAATARQNPLRQRIDTRGELEVIVGQAALRVGRQGQLDLVPRDRHVWVVVHLLGGRRDPVHEVDGALEVVELELALDRVAVALPAGTVVESCLNVV